MNSYILCSVVLILDYDEVCYHKIIGLYKQILLFRNYNTKRDETSRKHYVSEQQKYSLLLINK